MKRYTIPLIERIGSEVVIEAETQKEAIKKFKEGDWLMEDYTQGSYVRTILNRKEKIVVEEL